MISCYFAHYALKFIAFESYLTDLADCECDNILRSQQHQKVAIKTSVWFLWSQFVWLETIYFLKVHTEVTFSHNEKIWKYVQVKINAINETSTSMTTYSYRHVCTCTFTALGAFLVAVLFYPINIHIVFLVGQWTQFWQVCCLTSQNRRGSLQGKQSFCIQIPMAEKKLREQRLSESQKLNFFVTNFFSLFLFCFCFLLEIGPFAIGIPYHFCIQ